MEPLSEYEVYVNAWRARASQRAVHSREEQARALLVAARLADLLVTRFGASRVVLFGSRARGTARSGSDIDLAVAGVDPGVFFAAGAALERTADGFSVDLVPLESASPELLSLLSREGRELCGSG